MNISEERGLRVSVCVCTCPQWSHSQYLQDEIGISCGKPINRWNLIIFGKQHEKIHLQEHCTYNIHSVED